MDARIVDRGIPFEVSWMLRNVLTQPKWQFGWWEHKCKSLTALLDHIAALWTALPPPRVHRSFQQSGGDRSALSVRIGSLFFPLVK